MNKNIRKIIVHIAIFYVKKKHKFVQTVWLKINIGIEPTKGAENVYWVRQRSLTFYKIMIITMIGSNSENVQKNN